MQPLSILILGRTQGYIWPESSLSEHSQDLDDVGVEVMMQENDAGHTPGAASEGCFFPTSSLEL